MHGAGTNYETIYLTPHYHLVCSLKGYIIIFICGLIIVFKFFALCMLYLFVFVTNFFAVTYRSACMSMYFCFLHLAI